MKLLVALSFLFSTMIPMGKPDNNPDFVLVIHGGAGTILKENMTPGREKAYKDKLNEALEAGYNILNEGGTSVDAVEAAIIVLEDSPLFNAGKGSVYNSEGFQEMDASIMDGAGLKAGAVAGVRNIKNPITAAKAVMLHSPHVMLTGDGAQKFALSRGLTIVEPAYFQDSARYEQWRKIKEKEKADDEGHILKHEEYKWGTVGAVALDKHGNLAAGTSTGGMTYKKYGRVGDSPIIGAGTYAKNGVCAVSCTGHGEYFIRLGAAKDVSALIEYKKLSVDEAAHEVIRKIGEMGATGGLIALDSQGNISMPFNTAGMYRGYVSSSAERQVLLYK